METSTLMSPYGTYKAQGGDVLITFTLMIGDE
jgi:hypothetical protein